MNNFSLSSFFTLAIVRFVVMSFLSMVRRDVRRNIVFGFDIILVRITYNCYRWIKRYSYSILA